MAYDQALAELIRFRLGGRRGLTEKEMFGGIGFLLNGNMAIGVNRSELMVRVGKEAHDEIVTLPGARIFDLSGRPMRGWLLVSREGFSSDEDLHAWIDRGVAHAESLPPK